MPMMILMIEQKLEEFSKMKNKIDDLYRLTNEKRIAQKKLFQIFENETHFFEICRMLDNRNIKEKTFQLDINHHGPYLYFEVLPFYYEMHCEKSDGIIYAYLNKGKKNEGKKEIYNIEETKKVLDEVKVLLLKSIYPTLKTLYMEKLTRLTEILNSFT
jgi:hypothetical protein